MQDSNSVVMRFEETEPCWYRYMDV